MVGPPFVISPTAVSNVLTPLLTAVSTGLAGTANGAPNRVLFQPGAEVAWDECDCGLLAVKVNRRYRTRGFPEDWTDRVIGNCDELGIVVDCSLQLVRCVPIVGENDSLPASDTALLNAAIREQEDAYTVWRTTQCYLTLLREPAPGSPQLITDYVINDQTPLGPQGGCAGTELHFKFGLYIDCGC